MAIRKRPGRASPFQVYWNNPFTGKRESASFVSLLEAKKHDSLIKHKLEYERETFRPDDFEEEPEGMTVEALFYLYIKGKRFEKLNAEKLLSAIDPIIEDIGHMDITTLSKTDIMTAMQRQLDGFARPPRRKADSKLPPPALKRVKPITVKNRFGILKSALNWAEEQGHIDHVPKFHTKKPSAEKIPPPTREECQAIFAVCAPHIQRVIVLGLSFGMRIGRSELLKATWADVNFTTATFRVWSANKNKEMPWRDIPIRADLVSVLKGWHDADMKEGMQHLIHYDGKPVMTTFGKAWKAALNRAGITRRIRPYDLRHAFATEALEGGADIGALAEIMGHADKTMILTTYQHVREQMKKQVISSLPELPICAQAHVPK